MDCHLFGLLIQRYHDGDLSSVERAEYENHRRACTSCRILDERFSAVFASLGVMGRFEPSEGFNEAVLSQVDIARYRVSAARKALRAFDAWWNRVPSPVRVGGVLATIFVLFVTAYRPFLDFLVSIGTRTLAVFGSGIVVLKELAGKSETVLEYLSSAHNYRIAMEALLRTFQKLIDTVPITHVALATFAILVVLVIVIKAARGVWRKGETHVGIY
jgi:hypothetical protein